MLHIGAHISTKPDYSELIEDTRALGGDTFAIFLRPPRGGKLRAMSESELDTFNKRMAESGFSPLVMHAPYIYNLASKDPNIRQKTKTSLAEDVLRLDNFTHDVYYNFHPGSHGQAGTASGIKHIQAGINEALENSNHAHLLLETMAGKGSEVGGKFQELSDILSGVNKQDQVDVCLDTCHVFDGGYDILAHLDDVLDEFDQTIGLSRLKAIHLNDSKFGLASKKDRHAPLGFGKLGLRGIREILVHPKLKDLPFILETPADTFSHKDQIALAKELADQEFSPRDYKEVQVELATRYPTLLEADS